MRANRHYYFHPNGRFAQSVSPYCWWRKKGKNKMWSTNTQKDCKTTPELKRISFSLKPFRFMFWIVKKGEQTSGRYVNQKKKRMRLLSVSLCTSLPFSQPLRIHNSLLLLTHRSIEIWAKNGSREESTRTYIRKATDEGSWGRGLCWIGRYDDYREKKNL